MTNVVENDEVDKPLLVSLRVLRSSIHGESFEQLLQTTRNALPTPLIRKLEGVNSGNSRMKSILKSLLSMASNLSQPREFRDLFEDTAKVGESLKDAGLTVSEMHLFFIRCITSMHQQQDPNSTKSDTSQVKDWMRFITFTRLCIATLVHYEKH